MTNFLPQAEDSEINKIFEAIAFREDKIIEKAFADGLQKGIRAGDEKGYRIGFLKGVEFGVEIGYYEGIASALIKLTERDPTCLPSKTLTVLNKLRASLASVPSTNCPDTDILDLRNGIRSYYKQLCSLLKLDIVFNEEELTF